MNNLEVFNFENEEVRSLLINSEPWFVGKDVADILKYKNGSRDINRHVDEEDRKKAMIFDGNQNKETIIINESGLYSLILYSKMPSAKKFKRFITSEVIPSLRKHGVYATEETIDKILSNPDFGIRLLNELPTQKSMNLKVMEIKERTVNNSDGSVRITKTPMITGKGQVYFVNKYKEI